MSYMGEKMKRRPASLIRALRMGFRDAYDHIGYVVLVSLASFAVSAGVSSLAMVPFASLLWRLPLFVAGLPAILAAYLCAVGAYYYVHKAVSHEHPALSDTWLGIRRSLGPAIKLFVVDLGITAMLVGDSVFFALMIRRGPIMVVPAVLCFYLTIAWLMMAMYHLPLFMAQERMESGQGPLVILKKSLLLVVDNPGFTVGIFIVIIAITLVCAIPLFIGIAVLHLGVTAFVLAHALRELFIRYDIVEDEPEIVNDRPWSLPDSWRKRNFQDENTSLEQEGMEQHG
jgi:hypothetical protein